ncbi:MAG: hypothetical protein N2053_03925 [Chitinispirillaceae bacterium]|nr:hypothetical protein [Chitinispirillaceae bacterium]
MVLRKILIFLLVIILMCSSGGRILHVDNRESIPYTAENFKLKRKILNILEKRGLITGEQKSTCQINIMEIENFYMVEVWPHGISSYECFGVKLGKTFFNLIERYFECRDTTSRKKNTSDTLYQK